MRRERVVRGEVLAAVRERGIGSLDEVAAVVLETDGTFSVVSSRDGGRSSLEDVHGEN